jgi:hypothetical protein
MKKQVKEKFNFNKRVIPKIKYHPFYIDLDGKRPPPKFIIWYLNMSILISISVWFIPESINQYAITHYFIDFMQVLVPKIADFKDLAYEGHVVKTVPFYVSLVWFWIIITFLPLVYVQGKFMSKEILLGGFEYYHDKFCKYKLKIKEFIYLFIISIVFPYLVWQLSPNINEIESYRFDALYRSFLGIIILHLSIIVIYFLASSIIVGVRSRIILIIFIKTTRRENHEQ